MPDLWVRRPRPNPRARFRLFCFPYAGGGASVFFGWEDKLPPDLEVCPIQLPGRENRLSEPLFTRLPPLVEALGEAIRPYLNLPFAFFGHSLGALIGFELIRHLRKQNNSNASCLFVSGCRAPQMPRRKPPIHRLPDHEFLEEIRNLKGTPEPVMQHSELIELLLNTLRADFTMVELYDYISGNPLDCPISAFGGLHDEVVIHEDIAAWGEQTCGFFRLRMLPGDHFFLHSNRSLLLNALKTDLMEFTNRKIEQ